MERNKKTKIAIAVLACLLACSLLATGGVLVYRAFNSDKTATVSVPDNLITPDADSSQEDSASADNDTADSGAAASDTGSAAEGSSAAAKPAQGKPTAAKKAATIALHARRTEENVPFAVTNMLPGDSELQAYRVQVSYHDKVTVHFRATVRPGYEKLAEVLMVRVDMPEAGGVLYEGRMADMPKSVTHKLASKSSTTDELYYEITAYLDTSVGNDYQNKALIADFKWWVEETGNMDSPNTGVVSAVLPWILLAAASGAALLFLLLLRRRREEEKDG